MLLDKGMPVHQVAARIGDDPAVLLRVYGSIPTPNSNCAHTGSNQTGTTIGAGPTSRRFGMRAKQPRQPPRRRFLQHEQGFDIVQAMNTLSGEVRGRELGPMPGDPQSRILPEDRELDRGLRGDVSPSRSARRGLTSRPIARCCRR